VVTDGIPGKTQKMLPIVLSVELKNGTKGEGGKL